MEAIDAVRLVDVAVDLQQQLHVGGRFVLIDHRHSVAAVAAACAAAAAAVDIKEARVGLIRGQLELPYLLFAPQLNVEQRREVGRTPAKKVQVSVPALDIINVISIIPLRRTCDVQKVEVLPEVRVPEPLATALGSLLLRRSFEVACGPSSKTNEEEEDVRLN